MLKTPLTCCKMLKSWYSYLHDLISIHQTPPVHQQLKNPMKKKERQISPRLIASHSLLSRICISQKATISSTCAPKNPKYNDYACDVMSITKFVLSVRQEREYLRIVT